ncbi:MAG TPA: DNA mismatch repair protein MutT [Caldisericia bacterium]|nr:DNA mismatch repair protein MutT [Caldisericia bacterium]HPB33910.1 DNA mismatch repair protein MutT [Caldisericia bacterium]HQL66488.1 DNA mismatch repair protein MutT [Caldisericia bacterium]HQO99147.1 DNA mismatch repair protein MutT [Caldisericia bacterium]
MLETAKRESCEETKIIKDNKFYKLGTMVMIPKTCFSEHKKNKDIYVIPEYCFAVLLKDEKLIISKEDLEYCWLNYKEAMNCLKYDSNKTALRELKEKINDGVISVSEG